MPIIVNLSSDLTFLAHHFAQIYLPIWHFWQIISFELTIFVRHFIQIYLPIWHFCHIISFDLTIFVRHFVKIYLPIWHFWRIILFDLTFLAHHFVRFDHYSHHLAQLFRSIWSIFDIIWHNFFVKFDHFWHQFAIQMQSTCLYDKYKLNEYVLRYLHTMVKTLKW